MSSNKRTRISKCSDAKRAKYDDTESKISSGWVESEVEELLKSILCHGHLDYEKIRRNLPNKSQESYQAFLRQTSKIAKTNDRFPPETIYNLNQWIEVCESKSNGNGPLELGLVLKLLSMDGVLENHPLPENSDGVDFGACYRVIYQALLGHPIQPVNKPTLDMIYDSFTELNERVEQNGQVLEEIRTFLNSKYNITPLNEVSNDLPTMFDADLPKKPVKTYKRKRPNLNSPAATTGSAVNISVEQSTSTSSTSSYSLKINEEEVPLKLPERIPAASVSNEERRMMESGSYNPLELPINWLKNGGLKISFDRLKLRMDMKPKKISPTDYLFREN